FHTQPTRPPRGRRCRDTRDDRPPPTAATETAAARTGPIHGREAAARLVADQDEATARGTGDTDAHGHYPRYPRRGDRRWLVAARSLSYSPVYGATGDRYRGQHDASGGTLGDDGWRGGGRMHASD